MVTVTFVWGYRGPDDCVSVGWFGSDGRVYVCVCDRWGGTSTVSTVGTLVGVSTVVGVRVVVGWGRRQ